MSKIITKLGACSTKKKPLGMQFVINGSEAALGGSYAISGETATVSSEALAPNLVIGDSFKRTGCKHCGNKFVYQCGACKRFICYDGRAIHNAKCPACGATADVPAASANRIPVTGATGRFGASDTVQLEQGDVVSIKLPDGSDLKRIYVGVGWDPASTGSNMDVDSTVVLSGSSEQEIVYFGNLNSKYGCVTHHGDNLTGADKGGNQDDENIDVYLDKVPSSFNKIYFLINIYSSVERGQTLGDVRNMYIRLYEPTTRQVLVEYHVKNDVSSDRGIIIGKAFRNGSGWDFKAVGQGSRAATIRALADEAERL